MYKEIDAALDHVLVEPVLNEHIEEEVERVMADADFSNVLYVNENNKMTPPERSRNTSMCALYAVSISACFPFVVHFLSALLLSHFVILGMSLRASASCSVSDFFSFCSIPLR